jgi:hypothetical protein
VGPGLAKSQNAVDQGPRRAEVNGVFPGRSIARRVAFSDFPKTPTMSWELRIHQQLGRRCVSIAVCVAGGEATEWAFCC